MQIKVGDGVRLGRGIEMDGMGHNWSMFQSLNTELIDWFAGGYHAACGPCGTISPKSARFNDRSRRRADRWKNGKISKQKEQAKFTLETEVAERD